MDAQITTALIGVAGVAGTVGGTVLGSWLQARGGRAQAEAARDAAATAARAAHAQAVRERVWTVLPVYLRAASEFVDAVERHVQVEATAEVQAARRAFDLAHAEAELVVPEEMREVLAALRGSQNDFLQVDRAWGRSMRARHALEQLEQAGDAAACRAMRELRDLERPSRPGWGPAPQPERRPDPGPAIAALTEVTALAPAHRFLLIGAARHDRTAPTDRVEHARETYRQARRAVIDATRTALGTSTPAPGA